MLGLLIASFFFAVVLGHLVKDQNAVRRDREFYEELIAAQQNSMDAAERDAPGGG